MGPVRLLKGTYTFFLLILPIKTTKIWGWEVGGGGGAELKFWFQCKIFLGGAQPWY